jgi:serine protease Do
VLRDGKEKSFSVTVGTLPVEAEAAAGPRGEGDSGDAMGKLGLAVQTLTPEVARQLGYQGQKGAIIGGTRPGSPAARAGLRRGDLVVEANRKPVTDVESLRTALTSAGDSILLRIRRGEASLFVVLALK